MPFFLFLQTFAIHDYRPPPDSRDRFRDGPTDVRPLRSIHEQREHPYTAAEIEQLVDLYDAAIHGVDAKLGELLATLERSEDPLALVATQGELERAQLLADGLRLSDPTGARREARRAEHLTEQVAWYSEQDERRHVVAFGCL